MKLFQNASWMLHSCCPLLTCAGFSMFALGCSRFDFKLQFKVTLTFRPRDLLAALQRIKGGFLVSNSEWLPTFSFWVFPKTASVISSHTGRRGVCHGRATPKIPPLVYHWVYFTEIIKTLFYFSPFSLYIFTSVIAKQQRMTDEAVWRWVTQLLRCVR